MPPETAPSAGRLASLSWSMVCALALLSFALMRSVLRELELPDFVALSVPLLTALLWLRAKHSASGIHDLRRDLLNTWQGLSAWLAETGWRRLIGVGLLGMVAGLLIVDSLTGSAELPALIVGLVFALAALKLAQNKRRLTPASGGPASTSATNVAAASGNWLTRLTWPRWVLLSVLLLVAAGLTDEIFKQPKKALQVNLQAEVKDAPTTPAPAPDTSTPQADSHAADLAEAQAERAAAAAERAAELAAEAASTPAAAHSKPEVKVDIGPRGITVLEQPSDGSPATRLEIGIDGIKVHEGVSEAPTPPAPPLHIPELRKIPDIDEGAAQAIEHRIAREHQLESPLPADEEAGFNPAPLVVLVLVALTIMKLLAGGKQRAEQDASSARIAADLARLEREAADARLHAMQAQVEPHFLFNTLASVDQLIQSDPARASQVQKTLIHYLRAAIPQIRDDAQRSNLGRQVAMSRAYLEIMQVRMEERLSFTIKVPDGLAGAEFPSMMLQTMIENSIKHGLEPKTEGGHIEVAAEVTRGKLRVQVSDSGAGLAAEHPDGVGLANIRERLRLLYGKQASLAVSALASGGTLARIELPYRDEGSDADAAAEEVSP